MVVIAQIPPLRQNFCEPELRSHRELSRIESGFVGIHRWGVHWKSAVCNFWLPRTDCISTTVADTAGLKIEDLERLGTSQWFPLGLENLAK